MGSLAFYAETIPFVANILDSMDPALASAIALHRQGRLDQAEKSYDALITGRPDMAEAHNALGILRLQTGRPESALTAFDTALALQPGYVGAWGNRGAALKTLGKADLALEAMEQALALAPDSAEPHYNLACLHHEAGRLEQAVALYVQTTVLEPRHAGAWNNLGKVYYDLSRLEESIAAFSRALALAPDNANFCYALSHSQLRAGHWTAGWNNHEKRFDAGIVKVRHQKIPRWRGESPQGLTILVWSEQGLGDCLQFSRFAVLLAERGARVVFEVPSPLSRLLSELPGVTVVEAGQPLPRVDRQCPLLSLPLHLEQEIPFSSGPILAHMRDGGPDCSSKESLSVGVVWAGNPSHHNDANRSLPPEALRPLAGIPGLRLQSLQLGVAPPSFLMPLSEPPLDMADTARIMAGLDLVVSVDSAPLHLAGALGMAAWGLLAQDCDWRWGEDADSTDWYPGMRLYRQKTYRDWSEVIHRVATDLSTLVLEKFGKGTQSP